MFDHLIPYIPHIVLTTIIVGILWYAHHNTKHPFNVFDYFMDEATGKPSVTRPLQMIGGLTATWIVVKMTADKSLTEGMFAIYLGAMGLMAAYSKFLGSKTSKDEKDAK